jgi:hypothetical protein
MAFEAKSLRVQLPCGSVTVIDGDRYEIERDARRYLRDVITRRLTSPSPCCARATGEEDCVRGSRDLDLAALTDRVCMGTDALDVRTVVHARVLPELRRQLEERLREIDEAQAAVAQVIGDQPVDG